MKNQKNNLTSDDYSSIYAVLFDYIENEAMAGSDANMSKIYELKIVLEKIRSLI